MQQLTQQLQEVILHLNLVAILYGIVSATGVTFFCAQAKAVHETRLALSFFLLIKT